LPRTLQLPARPTTRLRVAPYPASFGRAGDESSSCPESSVHSAVPETDFRVASNLASFSGTVDETPSCPGSSLGGIAWDESPGCPEFCISRLCRRWISELPRISHPSAVSVRKLRVAPALRSSLSPPMRFRVAPIPASSGPGWRFTKLPWISHLPALPSVNLRVAPNFPPLARQLIKSPGCPKSSILQRCRRLILRVAPNPQPFGGAVSASPGCPASASTAGSMMSPRLYSNFASSGKPADEPSCAIESRSPCLTLDAFSISNRLSTAGKPTMNRQFNLNTASTCLTRISRCDQCSLPVADSDSGTQRLSSDLRSPSGSLNPSGS